MSSFSQFKAKAFFGTLTINSFSFSFCLSLSLRIVLHLAYLIFVRGHNTYTNKYEREIYYSVSLVTQKIPPLPSPLTFTSTWCEPEPGWLSSFWNSKFNLANPNLDTRRTRYLTSKPLSKSFFLLPLKALKNNSSQT
jgi:hypothetical protein